METRFGMCDKCKSEIEAVWFIEKEYKGGYPTGRTRSNVDYLICFSCGEKGCVDDTFAGPWR